jgi:deoxyadenosine/deoxycytidine kinase
MSELGLIAIAGVVGVGKTTLAGELARILHAPLICEEYGQNPFLSRELEGDQKAALASELFFLMSRAKQLNRQAIESDPTVICDYIFYKNRIFANMNLDAHQLGIYNEMEIIVESQIASPQLVIYLQDTTENCLERIQRRGRDFERSLSKTWLDRLRDAYENLFRDWRQCPVLSVDCGRYDVRQEKVVQNIMEQAKKLSSDKANNTY